MREVITMSHKELDRVDVLEQLKNKQISQQQAANILGLSSRQVRRLQRRYDNQGLSGLVHLARGKVSNRKIDQAEIQRAISLVKKHYSDFGPTFAHEKLRDNHGFKFGVDVLRQAMIEEGIWQAKQRRRFSSHQLRERRSCEGELLQLDGSPHDWFEGRGDSIPCTLLNAVDDATSKIEHGKFVKSESLLSYFDFVEEYFQLHGKPVAWYTDKHSTFRINQSKQGQAGIADSHGFTQFSRAMKQLNIAMIFANTPQAKGRVERSNQTLQDRLVKEMRLQGINNMEAGNKYLPTFIKDYNQRFGVTPQLATNLHRPLTEQDKLDKILTKQEERVLSKNLTCQYQNHIYQIQTQRQSYTLRKARVLVQQDKTGKVSLLYRGKVLDYTVIQTKTPNPILTSKEVNQHMDQLRQKTEVKQQNLWDKAASEAWEEYFYA